MPEYHVTWEIDSVDAETPEDAARFCREMLLDPDNTASIFQVELPDGTEPVLIDTLKARYEHVSDAPDLDAYVAHVDELLGDGQDMSDPIVRVWLDLKPGDVIIRRVSENAFEVGRDDTTYLSYGENGRRLRRAIEELETGREGH